MQYRLDNSQVLLQAQPIPQGYIPHDKMHEIKTWMYHIQTAQFNHK